MKVLRDYRWLILIYAVALVVGYREYQRTKQSAGAPPNNAFTDPRRDYAEAMAQLYPGRAETEFYLGFRAQSRPRATLDREALARDPQALEKFLDDLQSDLRRASEHYEKAIAGGLRSKEDLYYQHALALARLQAPGAQVDEAIAIWRRNFPNSEFDDLQERREKIEQEYRTLSRKIRELREAQEIDAQRRAFQQQYGLPGVPGGSERKQASP